MEVVNGKGASVALQLVIAGQAQVSRSGGANYMVARVNSGAAVSIGTIAQVSPFFVVSSPKAKINSPADMKGKISAWLLLAAPWKYTPPHAFECLGGRGKCRAS